ncbi:hypothetical protein [Georgenia sp. Z1491]|uniref:hypothetical protein n=1 Tax=Georgenia sp. Z1491 TaxID=3416707 RepID=UPI003CEE76A5
MEVALLVLIGVPLLLLALGISITARAVASLRERSVPRAAGILRVVAGVGVVVCALLPALVLVTEVQYGVVAFPVLGLVGAAVWGSLFLAAAAVVEGVARRRRPWHER